MVKAGQVAGHDAGAYREAGQQRLPLMSKIFAIGLSKTGTTSLAAALEILGYRVARTGESLPAPADFDAATHENVPAGFDELDRQYPNSRFIYTIRERTSWARSVERNWRFHHETNHPTYQWLNTLYGTSDWSFDEQSMQAAYDRHRERVTGYFTGRELLVMDICGGDGWEKLCSFLSLPMPDVPFPRGNVGTGSPWRRLRWHARRVRKRFLKPVYKPVIRALRW